MTPPDGERLANRLTADGWTVRTNPGEGTVPRQTYGPPRGDGTRPVIHVDDPCTSWRLIAVHPDGRGFVAVWIHRHGDLTPKRREPRWAIDTCWRAPRAGEYGPQPLPLVRDLDAYTAPAEQETAA